MNILARIFSAFGFRPSDKRVEELAERCGFFTTFIETRYGGHPVPVPPGDEKTFYDACCFCGNIDSDGMAALLGQAASAREAMEHGLRQLGLEKLIDLAARASDAVGRSGLSLDRSGDRSAIKAMMEPFEDEYYNKVRGHAYARLHKFVASRPTFAPYARNCARIEREGGNPFDPKEWAPEKMAMV